MRQLATKEEKEERRQQGSRLDTLYQENTPKKLKNVSGLVCLSPPEGACIFAVPVDPYTLCVVPFVCCCCPLACSVVESCLVVALRSCAVAQAGAVAPEGACFLPGPALAGSFPCFIAAACCIPGLLHIYDRVGSLLAAGRKVPDDPVLSCKAALPGASVLEPLCPGLILSYPSSALPSYQGHIALQMQHALAAWLKGKIGTRYALCACLNVCMHALLTPCCPHRLCFDLPACVLPLGKLGMLCGMCVASVRVTRVVC